MVLQGEEKPLKSTPKGNNNLLGQKWSGRYIIPMVLMYAIYVPLTQVWLHRRLDCPTLSSTQE